jgi:hypothetical protein
MKPEYEEMLNESKRHQKPYAYGPMQNKTRTILAAFYRPHCERLAEILKDDKFLWQD